MRWLSGIRKAFHNDGGKDRQESGTANDHRQRRVHIPHDENEAAHAGEPPSKDAIIEAACYYTCSKVCYGVKGQAAQCCAIGERDFIIGPIDDTERFLKDLSSKLGRAVEYADVFMDFEEGSKLFPEKKLWQDPENYPCMRIVDDASIGYPCQFLDQNMKCMVHSIKPDVCRRYLCPYLREIVDQLEYKLDPPDE